MVLSRRQLPSSSSSRSGPPTVSARGGAPCARGWSAGQGKANGSTKSGDRVSRRSPPQGDEAAVDAPVAQAVENLGGACLGQGQRQEREFLAQEPQDQREEIGAERLDRGQHQPAGQRRAAPLDREGPGGAAPRPAPRGPAARWLGRPWSGARRGSKRSNRASPSAFSNLRTCHRERRLADVAALGGAAECPSSAMATTYSRSRSERPDRFIGSVYHGLCDDAFANGSLAGHTFEPEWFQANGPPTGPVACAVGFPGERVPA